MLTFKQLQDEQVSWVQHNFPGRKSFYPLLGVVEELGELAHTHLKALQGIRGTPEEHEEAGKDAIGDIVIFLSDYCTAMGWDFQEIVEHTWFDVVKKRDWQANRDEGV